MAEDHLRVYLRGRHIGNLIPVRSGARFMFLEEIANAMEGSPLLSTALTVQREAFNRLQTANWFAGLLPEDNRLVEISRFYGINQSNYYDVLREIGWECAGAVSVLPEEAVITATETSDKTLIISKEELAARLRALPSHPYDDVRTLRVSLGGFQEKLCIVAPAPIGISDGYAVIDKVGIPLDGTISTHILKPQPERFPGMIEGEAWAMAAASMVTPTAKTALLEVDGAPLTLVVQRFDRTEKNGVFNRIHQEDCAQAMGLSPNQKYAASGTPRRNDPTLLWITSLLKNYAENPLEQMEQLLCQVFVNIVLGNTDAHAKNYAFLHPDENTISLSPMYDVVPATEITPQVVEMGMRVNGRIRHDRIEYEQILNEAVSWGLPHRQATTVLKGAADKLREGIEQASKLYPQAARRHKDATLTRLGKVMS